MIVVDTCVLSEPLRSAPSERVTHWLATHSAQICTTSITVAELRYGVERLPPGARKTTLGERIDAMFAQGIIVAHPFDAVAARRYSLTRAAREALGRPLATEDGMIAAIAFSHGLAVATRNTRDFDDLGVAVVNPWEG